MGEGRAKGWCQHHRFLINISQMVPEDPMSATCPGTRETQEETVGEMSEERRKGRTEEQMIQITVGSARSDE